jgi:hypothetical protein
MRPALHLTLAALALIAAALAALVRNPQPPLGRDEVSAVQLAEWIRARRPGLLVLDTRRADALARDGLPGARPAGAAADAVADTLVLYAEEDLADLPARLPRASRVLRLRGGLKAWNSQVLFPVRRSDASARERRDFAARAGLSRYFGGSPRVLEPGARAERGRSRRG